MYYNFQSILLHVSVTAMAVRASDNARCLNYSLKKCCSNKYKVRCFNSTGALLVIIWIGLLVATAWSLVRLYTTLFQGLKYTGAYSELALIPVIPFFILVPLFGWIADVHLGNYKVFKTGLILTFLAAVLSCVCVLILSNVEDFDSTVSRVISGSVSLVVYVLAFTGVAACCFTALQLGLDQMPDASSANITSFINWFFFFIFLGYWMLDTIFTVLLNCASTMDNESNMQIFSFLSAVSACICCSTFFLLAPKWLIIEPKCPQSLKTIYQVLKFAAKHKTTINRSALTYWEEDLPSRIDLGKARYGGPFTSEQVEDVKTFFKIAVIFLPVAITALSVTPKYNMSIVTNNTSAVPFAVYSLGACNSGLVYAFTYSPWWCSIVIILISELVIYPVLQEKVPSMLKCIGIASFFVVFFNTCFLVFAIIDLLYFFNLSFWVNSSYNIIYGVFLQYMLRKHFEFVCAQSPYNMRGLLAGYMLFLFLGAMGIGIAIVRLSDNDVVCEGRYCLVIQKCSLAALSLIGFVLHCVLARWYKWRVRDEEYTTYRVVEEIYGRCLS